jgi:serine/threonine protein phosphatase PrpC
VTSFEPTVDATFLGCIREMRVGLGTALLYSVRCPGGDGPNEDSALVVDLSDDRGVLAVAAGLGGKPGGEVASRLAIESVQQRLRTLEGQEGLSVRTATLDAIEDANRSILALGVGAGSTLALVELRGTSMRPYHVGDSEIMVFGQRGRVKYQTVAHSPTAYAVESGLLDAADALTHRDRHLVSNVLGDSEMRVEMGSWLPIAPRDTILVATDGVFDNFAPREIVELARKGPLGEAAKRLAAACSQRMLRPRQGRPSKPDDLTFILYRPDPRRARDLSVALAGSRRASELSQHP